MSADRALDPGTRGAFVRALATACVSVMLALVYPGCRQEGSTQLAQGVTGVSTSAVVCGLPISEPPSEAPSDACRGGEVVLGPQRVEREAGPPTDVTFTFDAQESGPGCLSVQSSGEDGRHRVAAAWVYLDDELVIAPERFDQNVTTVEQPIFMDAGAHSLRVRVASVPGTYVDVTVKVGGTGAREGVVQSEHLEVFNLYAEPSVFSPLVTGARLWAQGTVLRFAGLPSGRYSYEVRWAFEIRSAESCDLVRVLLGEQQVHTPSSFSATAVWDGKDKTGCDVASGVYIYRLQVDGQTAQARKMALLK